MLAQLVPIMVPGQINRAVHISTLRIILK